jgi:hypothetical protein
VTAVPARPPAVGSAVQTRVTDNLGSDAASGTGFPGYQSGTPAANLGGRRDSPPATSGVTCGATLDMTPAALLESARIARAPTHADVLPSVMLVRVASR